MSQAELIEGRRPSARRGKFIAALTRNSARMRTADRPLTREDAAHIVQRAFAAQAMPDRRVRRSPIAVAASALLIVTALAMAAVGLVMNARFAASFGQTAEAAALLAMIGLAIDVLAVALPSVAAQLWHDRNRAAAAIAASIWLVSLTMSLLAATGFASTNIGDAVASRAKIAGENAALAEKIERLHKERADITEARAAAAIEAQLQEAQPSAQAVWRSTDGCRDVTRARSGRACAPVLALREAQAAAERRDAIEAELRDAQARLATLPAIVTADPQAKAAAEIVSWLSGGLLVPAPRDIAWLRTIGLAVMPSLAGLVVLLALSLSRQRRSA